jgi:nucleotide-binding universal stress UspA family protein
MNLTHILAPVDFSKDTSTAVSAALEFASKTSTKITLLHVLPVLYPGHLQPIFAYERQLKALEVESEKQLRDLAGTIAPQVDVETALKGGPPWKAIVEFAGAHRVDLIVMPTHGRSGLGHILLGSVAERVVQHAPCNVLIVRSATTQTEPSGPTAENRKDARVSCACPS